MRQSAESSADALERIAAIVKALEELDVHYTSIIRSIMENEGIFEMRKRQKEARMALKFITSYILTRIKDNSTLFEPEVILACVPTQLIDILLDNTTLGSDKDIADWVESVTKTQNNQSNTSDSYDESSEDEEAHERKTGSIPF